MIRTIEWAGDSVVMIDQRLLPNQEIYRTCRTHHEVAEAIKTMVIRGAPAIGVAAAMGIALGVKNSAGTEGDALAQEFEAICQVIGATRPTAVNLFWAIRRMRRVFESVRSRSPEEIKKRLEEEALAIFREDIALNERMGRHGQALLKDGSTVLTHCNAGALATAGYGTALGVIRAAVEAGKKIAVVADETRPFLQGSRLTAWELVKDGIPVTLITDNTAGSLMRSGRIHSVIVGADRIAANGDVANKIGTYPLAVLARENGIPFYVAAPTSTVDLSVPDGDHIPIEERDPSEVLFLQGQPIAPPEVQATNLAFDVTPHRYVSAIITESGIATAPYGETLPRMVQGNPRGSPSP